MTAVAKGRLLATSLSTMAAVFPSDRDDATKINIVRIVAWYDPSFQMWFYGFLSHVGDLLATLSVGRRAQHAFAWRLTPHQRRSRESVPHNGLWKPLLAGLPQSLCRYVDNSTEQRNPKTRRRIRHIRQHHPTHGLHQRQPHRQRHAPCHRLT